MQGLSCRLHDRNNNTSCVLFGEKPSSEVFRSDFDRRDGTEQAAMKMRVIINSLVKGVGCL